MDNAKSDTDRIGKKVRIARINKGIKQYELADRIGVTANYISLIEAGKKSPSLRITRLLADTLDVSVGTLIDDQQILYDLKELSKKYDLGTIIEGLQKLKTLILKK